MRNPEPPVSACLSPGAGALLATAAFAALPAAATEPEPLDEEFLEYLSEFESKDDWSWFDSHDDKEPADNKSAPPKQDAAKDKAP